MSIVQNLQGGANIRDLGYLMTPSFLNVPYLLSGELTSFLNVPSETVLSHVEILSMIQYKCLNGNYVIDPTNQLSILFSLGLGSITVNRYFSVIDQHLCGPSGHCDSVNSGEDPISIEIISSEPDLVSSEPDLVSSEPDLVSSEPDLVSSEPESLPSNSNNVTQVSYVSIINDMREYVAENSPKLYILTPCFGGQCFVNFVTSLMITKDLFANIGFPLQVEFMKNDSLISRARNNLVARAMNDPEMTHIIFIDNDITWNPIDILKMVLSNKSVIGGVYPLKKYLWDRLIPSDSDDTIPYMKWTTNKRESAALSHMSDTTIIQAKLLKYNVNYLNNFLSLENGIAEVKHVATGFMMIQRSVFTQMFEEFPLTKYTDDVNCLTGSEHDFAYALFDCGVKEGHYFSEDWLFCDRWTNMGGHVHIEVGVQLMHTGIEDYEGSYIASLFI